MSTSGASERSEILEIKFSTVSLSSVRTEASAGERLARKRVPHDELVVVTIDGSEGSEGFRRRGMKASVTF